VIGDYFSRLHSPDNVTARSVTLFEGICRVSDRMRVRWSKEQGWLQFRSASFFNDRIKEVPNRLFEKWASARKQKGRLGVEELSEIASLTDAQLDSLQTGSVARALYGLSEFEMARSPQTRPHLRFFAGLGETPRKSALTNAGISFAQLPASEQQRFVNTVLSRARVSGITLDQVSRARLTVEDDPERPVDSERPEEERPRKAPLRFTYRLPDSQETELVWIVEPTRSSINSAGERNINVVR
jgi:hypothetical protein